MSENFLQEYKDYYAVRAKKYEGNPKYQNSYRAEKNMSDAMQSCSTLEEFKDKIGNMNELCAVALVKDDSLMEKTHFSKHQEIVRIKASERILEKVDEFTEVMELISTVTEITNKNSIEISMDESHRELSSDWYLLDKTTIFENAEVPNKYKDYMQKVVQSTKNSIIEGIEFLEKNNHEWQADWKIIPELNMEFRHKRLIPYNDEHIQEQINKYKSIINR